MLLKRNILYNISLHKRNIFLDFNNVFFSYCSWIYVSKPCVLFNALLYEPFKSSFIIGIFVGSCNMSSISEIAKGGISITWQIDNFLSIQSIWWTAFSLEWAETNSKWKLEINFSSDGTSVKCIRLVIEKLDKLPPFCLSGIISAVVENFAFELHQFEGNNFRKSKEKHMWLTPNQGIDFESKGYINNDHLTLRLNLWDPGVNDLVAAEYFVRSEHIQQTCSFQWRLKENTTGPRNNSYLKSVIEIPMEFTDFSINSSMETFRVNFSLQIEDGNMYAVLQTKATKSKYFFIRGRFKLKIHANGGIEPVLDTEWNTFEFSGFKSYKNIVTEEEWDIIDPQWSIKMEVIIVTDFKGVIERICYQPGSQNLIKNPAILEKRKQLSNDNLQSCLQTLFKEGKFCDVILRAENENFPCHKNVLCARSAVFRTMFEKNILGTKSNILNIEGIESRILGLFLNFLYSDNLKEENFELATKLYAVAKRYAVSKLRKNCAAIIVSRLSVDNSCEALDLADLHKDKNLKDEIISFFCDHSKEIMKSSKWKDLLTIKPLLAAKTAQAVLLKVQ